MNAIIGSSLPVFVVEHEVELVELPADWQELRLYESNKALLIVMFVSKTSNSDTLMLQLSVKSYTLLLICVPFSMNTCPYDLGKENKIRNNPNKRNFILHPFQFVIFIHAQAVSLLYIFPDESKQAKALPEPLRLVKEIGIAVLK